MPEVCESSGREILNDFLHVWCVLVTRWFAVGKLEGRKRGGIEWDASRWFLFRVVQVVEGD